MAKETAHSKRKKLGLCAMCGVAPRPANRTACPVCEAKRNAYQEIVREKRRVQGICVVCGQRPPEEGKTACTVCLEIRRNRSMVIARTEGVCSRCAQPNDNGKKLCTTCLEYKNKDNAGNKQAVIDAYGGRCACCGEDNPVFLSVDHINNDGNLHRKKGGGMGSSLYKWLIKRNFPKDNFQLLCHNCNRGKHLNGGICPHQQETGGIRICQGG